MKYVKKQSNHLKNSNHSWPRAIARAGSIGALYAALTLLVYPIAFGSIQLRLSEALTVLPLFFAEAIPGLWVGCIVANLLTPNIALLDVVFGGLATLAAAFCTSKLRGRLKWLAPLPPVVINAVVVGFVITISVITPGDSFVPLLLYHMATVGLGQAAVCYGLGVPLMLVLEKFLKRSPVS